MRRVLLAGALALALILRSMWIAEAGELSQHGTVTCATTATLIRGANSSRRSLIIVYTTAATTIYVGASAPSTLTTSNGIPLAGGASKSFSGGDGYTGAYSCITTSGTVDLRWEESY